MCLNGTRVALNAAERQPARPVRWTFRFPEGAHALSFDGTSWQLTAGEPEHQRRHVENDAARVGQRRHGPGAVSLAKRAWLGQAHRRVSRRRSGFAHRPSPSGKHD